MVLRTLPRVAARIVLPPGRLEVAEDSVGRTSAAAYPDPVDLVERDHELARLRRVIGAALAGAGAGLAVAGEAGTGKSSLVVAACRDAEGMRVLRGNCDPLSTPRPLGPFRDIGAHTPPAVPDQRDDVPLPLVCEEIYRWLRAEPTVLVVEDLHWVDAATIDVLRFLLRRVGSMPLAILVTYRDLEIGPTHSARPLLGDLARLDDVGTLLLAPLSADGVRQLVDGTGLDPARVHRVTGGNPYFVTEIVKEPQRPLPGSVRDAVLARAAALEPDDFEVLQLVATAPDRLDDRALPALGVDLPTLRRLDGTGLLVRTRGGVAFRHELARQAVESTVPPGGGHRLHRRMLDALELIVPQEPAVLTHHAVAARDTARAAFHARRAASEAARAGSHSDAVVFLRTALENLDDAPAADRAELLQRLAFEQYMTSRLADAVDNVRATFPLWREAGDASGLSGAHERCAVFEYYQARREQAEVLAERAARIALEGHSSLALGSARATGAFLAYMRGDADLATSRVSEATAIAQEHEATALDLRGRLVGTYVRLGRGDLRAREELLEYVTQARDHGWDELASTGYSQLAYLDVEHRRLTAAEHVLEQSLPFAASRDIWICQHWQTAVRARLRFVEGRWKAALEDAEYVLGEVGMPIARLWPHLVMASVRLRAGDVAPALDHLEDAWVLAGRIDEPLRTLYVLSALAEAQWLTGRDDDRVLREAPRLISEVAVTPGTAWALGELRQWLRRLGLNEQSGVTATDPAPYALAGEGRALEAAQVWERIGDPFTAAMALADSTDPVDRLSAIERLDAVGAFASADRVRVDLRREGVVHVPARVRASTRTNPGGLTNRQLDVARLVARGLTNAEIAGALFISPKTADHHVSAVLTKLGLASRRSVVVRAGELGLS